ncbi:hypothetical protein HYH02_004186 [Chlamydomonas schloesseri]|uniref:Uncharacterized protein n=1 Tax=Chlamydomonas schloesseri TaxID=2026947 RepID=A0A835WRL6_9CHLO|nr:hypothetical protein HYH02_004186 [Chlamydomonas schloesseri]|eukprot:KAG2451591.1 hypothetical protein HYH02_004186 [Chlamydomonas schloesseri]
MRAMLDNGEEITFNSRRGDRDRGVHWLDWCRKAFLELPGNEGTYEDLCASLEKDPEIAPLLDQRIDTGRRHRRSGARWRRNVLRALPKILGLTKTGEKQGRLSVYRYDPVAGELLAAAAKRRKQARGKGGGGKGEASMPHLGKEQ